MIAVIIITTGIFNNGRNPDRRKSQCFDVIEFFDETFKITSPGGVSLIQAFAIPAMYIVCGVSVVKSSGYYKVDRFIAKVGSGKSLAKKQNRWKEKYQEGQRNKKFFE
jgi:hypothetical protein